MSMSEHDRAVLEALASARKQHEELADLLAFYQELYEVQFVAKAELPEPEVRDEMAMRWRLEGGIPQLTFDQLRIAPEPFAGLARAVAEVLERHNPTWQIEWDDWQPADLVALAREIFETWDTLTSPQPDGKAGRTGASTSVQPMALTVGFSLAPHLQRASEVILPRLDLNLWTRGYCPVCGGRPNLALLEPKRGARQLLCSRCTSLWAYGRVGCPFCQSKEKQNYHLIGEGVYRLYVCPDCNRYLKTVDRRELQREVYPQVERLVTVGMDLAAQEKGYQG